jgi:hypothetical protein
MRRSATNAAPASSRHHIHVFHCGSLPWWRSSRRFPVCCSSASPYCLPSASSGHCSATNSSYSKLSSLASCWHSSGICTCNFRTSSGASFPNYFIVPAKTTMDIKLPTSEIKISSPSAPKDRVGRAHKPARLRPFPALYPLQPWQGQCKGQLGANGREPWPNLGPPGGLPGSGSGALHGKLPSELGRPLGLRQVAELIGCSPWTVRQTLMPRGLPFFRSAASGRLIFYTNQIVGWIEKQQGGIRQK